jgi:CheY-like chemotaxis protein
MRGLEGNHLTHGKPMPTRYAPDTESGADAASTDEPARALRILIVEDEAITAMHIEDIVRDLGHIVVDTVENGPAAVTAAFTLRPDLMLIDIRLAKGTDGIEAGMEIRRSLNIPLIFMSAHTDPATRKRADAAKPFGYVVKPFAIDQIATLLDRLSEETG